MREWKRILLCAGLAIGFGCDTDDDSAADLGLEGPSGPGAGMEIPGEAGEQQAGLVRAEQVHALHHLLRPLRGDCGIHWDAGMYI